MEYSSPLAAMRPQPCAAWGNRKDLPSSRSMYSTYQTYGPNNFNFKDLSMHNVKPAAPDYFSLRPARGSSPAASLTADLDANFHIDKRYSTFLASLVSMPHAHYCTSPQAPTPRRSLFTTDLFRPRNDAGPLSTPPIEIEEASGPSFSSSSPGMMDISPLPHKEPYFRAQVTLPSPSPEETPDEDDTFISPDLLYPLETEPYTAPVYQAPTFLALPERKRPATRPSLTRKNQSTSQIPQRPYSAEASLPPFRFGNVANNGVSCVSTQSLLESFSESPVDSMDTPSAASVLPLPRRPSLSAAGRTNGSPCTGHVRKPSAGRATYVRPQRKVMRRSLSMFQHRDDVMKEEQDIFEQSPGLSSVMDVDPEPAFRLPHFMPENEPDGLPRISQATLLDVLDNRHSSQYDNIKVIDCRFEYEFSGGHIDGAVNFNDKQLLTNELFNGSAAASTLLIFHCEYSVHRAPLTAKHIRSHDRNVNIARYPALTFPDVYILEGGYSKFFANHRWKCFPQSYVEMNDQRHEQDCERGMAKVKQRQKLSRAKTFAFGQNGHDDMNDSPTAQSRSMIAGARSQSTFDVGSALSEGIAISFSRRLASY
ncbi:m-phase inducer phosphatase [Friedmanniomyces endolithicus]|nr:m-phase inducer phosphatase [Friedmanniomyces endolithicus]